MSTEEIPARPGTYVLVLEAPDHGRIQVGSLGRLTLDGGWLCYVGSAMGPGGLRARVSRHLTGARKLHWHVDYLLREAKVAEVWHAQGEEKREDAWAEALRTSAGAGIPLAGFGSSDCGCPGHLIRFETRPNVEGFRGTLGKRAPGDDRSPGGPGRIRAVELGSE